MKLILEIFLAGATMILCTVAGYIIGVNATTKTLKFVGTLNIAHDTDGEKYTSLVINKQNSGFMDDESIKYVLMNVSHIYAEKQEAKMP